MRFGALSFARDSWADFDRRMIAACESLGGDPTGPDNYAPPAYAYRWGSTEASHCSGLMRAADDETWYERLAGKNDLRSVRNSWAVLGEASRI